MRVVGRGGPRAARAARGGCEIHRPGHARADGTRAVVRGDGEAVGTGREAGVAGRRGAGLLRGAVERTGGGVGAGRLPAEQGGRLQRVVGRPVDDADGRSRSGLHRRRRRLHRPARSGGDGLAAAGDADRERMGAGREPCVAGRARAGRARGAVQRAALIRMRRARERPGERRIRRRRRIGGLARDRHAEAVGTDELGGQPPRRPNGRRDRGEADPAAATQRAHDQRVPPRPGPPGTELVQRQTVGRSTITRERRAVEDEQHAAGRAAVVRRAPRGTGTLDGHPRVVPNGSRRRRRGRRGECERQERDQRGCVSSRWHVDPPDRCGSPHALLRACVRMRPPTSARTMPWQQQPTRSRSTP